MKPLKGIHHVTAITADGQRNADFYAGTLGLRLVKKTVNFDDPGSYHLYYGDEAATPGTLITFFVWPGAAAGRTGIGEPVATAFEVPEGTLDWWTERLHQAGFGVQREERFGDRGISFADPDGMRVELIESAAPRATRIWTGSGIDREHAIKTIHSITLSAREHERSNPLYSGELTFRKLGAEGGRTRFAVGANPGEGFVDLVTPAGTSGGSMGAGTIHHVAFRTDYDSTQREWLDHITGLGLNVSPVMDRKYFHSIYFRERNGVLFEIATDPPGMAVDEPAEHLGESLVLPGQYEPLRARLAQVLPPIAAPYLAASANVTA